MMYDVFKEQKIVWVSETNYKGTVTMMEDLKVTIRPAPCPSMEFDMDYNKEDDYVFANWSCEWDNIRLEIAAIGGMRIQMNKKSYWEKGIYINNISVMIQQEREFRAKHFQGIPAPKTKAVWQQKITRNIFWIHKTRFILSAIHKPIIQRRR